MIFKCCGFEQVQVFNQLPLPVWKCN